MGILKPGLTLGIACFFVAGVLADLQSAQSKGDSKTNPVAVGGDVAPPKRVKTVAPNYPADAPKGTMILELLGTPAGKVDSVRVVREVQGATAAAVEAVKQWEYEPLVVEGRAVWFKMGVVVSNPWK